MIRRRPAPTGSCSRSKQDYEVRDWAKSLGCTGERLRQAVKAVGNSADKVRDYLKK